MKHLRRIFLTTVAVVASILLFATCVLWIHSRKNIDHVLFTGSQQSVYLESSSRNGLLLRVTDLTPTISARVTGMTATPTGWDELPGQPVTMRMANLPAGTNVAPASPNDTATQTQPGPLAISRLKVQFHGLVWSTGFTASTQSCPARSPPARSIRLHSPTRPRLLS